LALDRELISNIPSHFDFQMKLPDQFKGRDLKVFFNDIANKIFLISVMTLSLLLVLIGLMVFQPFIRVLRWIFRTIFVASVFSLLAVMTLNIFVPVVFDKILSIFKGAMVDYNMLL